jgi:hypothetical protein
VRRFPQAIVWLSWLAYAVVGVYVICQGALVMACVLFGYNCGWVYR